MNILQQSPFAITNPSLGNPSIFGGGGFQQMQMLGQMMQVMMGIMTFMAQGLQGGGMLSPHSNFGAVPGMGAGGHGMPGLGNFLGSGPGGAAGSGRQGPHGLNGPAPAAAGSHQSAGVTNAANLSRAQAEDLVRKGGGQVNPNGRPTVLALRSATSATRTYKDTFIVLKPDGSMAPFEGNTRPSTSGKDKAMLKPGAYELSPRWRDGKFNNDAFVVKSANGSMNVGVGRDANGDGVYSDKEMNSNYSSSLIRFHRGRGNNTSSSGCINCKDYDGFLRAVGGRDASFNFVLVNQ